MTRCISGARLGARCSNPAVSGFAHCASCGRFLGAYWAQLPPGDPERVRMDRERAADARACKRRKK